MVCVALLASMRKSCNTLIHVGANKKHISVLLWMERYNMQVCSAAHSVPLMTQLELDSPGWTLADRTTYFLSPTHPGDTQEVNYHSSVATHTPAIV